MPKKLKHLIISWTRAETDVNPANMSFQQILDIANPVQNPKYSLRISFLSLKTKVKQPFPNNPNIGLTND